MKVVDSEKAIALLERVKNLLPGKDLHLSAFAPRWSFLYAVRFDAYRKFIATFRGVFITNDLFPDQFLLDPIS